MKKRKWSSDGYTLLSAVVVLFVMSLLMLTVTSTVQVRYLNAVKECNSFYSSVVVEEKPEVADETY